MFSGQEALLVVELKSWVVYVMTLVYCLSLGWPKDLEPVLLLPQFFVTQYLYTYELFY